MGEFVLFRGATDGARSGICLHYKVIPRREACFDWPPLQVVRRRFASVGEGGKDLDWAQGFFMG